MENYSCSFLSRDNSYYLRDYIYIYSTPLDTKNNSFRLSVLANITNKKWYKFFVSWTAFPSLSFLCKANLHAQEYYYYLTLETIVS